MKAQILAAREAFARTGRTLPIQCSVTLDPTGRMLLGTDIRGALATLEAMGVDDHRPQLLDRPGSHARRDPLPVAERRARRSTASRTPGCRSTTAAARCIPMQPEPMAETLREFVAEFGVNIVGGCCGTTPEHIRAHGRARSARARAVRRGPGRGAGWSLSSGMTATAMRQEPRPLLIGERLNTQGSRKVKRLALEDQLEEMIPVAREQVEGGAHALDVCMALTERTDEAAQMRRLVKKLALSVEAPLVIDSTEADVDRGGAQGVSGLRARQLDQPGERPRADRRGDAAGRCATAPR